MWVVGLGCGTHFFLFVFTMGCLMRDGLSQGNVGKKITKDLMAKLPESQTNKRGIVVDDYMQMLGAEGIYAMYVVTLTIFLPFLTYVLLLIVVM